MKEIHKLRFAIVIIAIGAVLGVINGTIKNMFLDEATLFLRSYISGAIFGVGLFSAMAYIKKGVAAGKLPWLAKNES